MRFRSRLLAATLCLAPAAMANAAVTPQEAAALKSTLTPLGAEKAGNKDGSIPAWTGGYTTVAPGWKAGQPRPDPFANEKPVLTITAANAANYASRLSEGDRALLEKYPDSFRINVYPTHRTEAAPAWVYDNTFRNATTATLTKGDLSVEGADGGVPFPIPKTGSEVLWNHLMSWRGQALFMEFSTWVGQSDGVHVLATQAKEWIQFPYYQKERPAAYSGVLQQLKQVATGPAFKVGEAILSIDHIDFASNPRQSWQYLTGQRRVRKAPTIGFDTPDFVTSGIANFDEAFTFNGSPERYQWKLIGKQEMYGPYNNNRILQVKADDALAAHHLNPDYVRYELHRVWVIEGEVTPGKRHVVARRRIYVDEDSWNPVGADEWDAQGKLWKHQFSLLPLAPDMPGVTSLVSWGVYNLQNGSFVWNNVPAQPTSQYSLIDPLPDTAFSADALAGEGVR